MYTIDEKKLDNLLEQSANISKYLAMGVSVPAPDANAFGRALLSIQTDVETFRYDRRTTGISSSTPKANGLLV